MDIRTVIFYVALLSIVVTVVELYVRMKGIGANVQKVHGVAVMTIPQ